ncbi:MAG: TolC family protein, partial [Acaryochloridaceae cyanobacterium SU_2_1]|nr:TolC family protein [Acaryochloridaceae cyanobacterium SU_2_1]
MIWVLSGAIATLAQPQTPNINPLESPLESPRAQPLRSPASDLKPFNPDPKLLEVPTRPAEVTLDAQLNQAITLEQAQELARRNNRDLQVAEIQLRQEQAALIEAKAALLPRVNSQASLSRTDSAASNIALNRSQNQIPGLQNQGSSISNSLNTSVQLDYDVFTSGQRTASIRAAESALKATEKALETQLQQLRQEVANDYYDMQQAGELVGIAQAAVENARLTLKDAKVLEEAGLGTRFDVLRAEVQLANQAQQLSQAQGQNQTAQRQLAERLSLPPTANLSAADPVEVMGWWPLSLPESIVLAQQNRSELGELLDQRQIAQQNQRLILGSLGPQFSVSASGTFAADLGQPDAAFGYSLGGQVRKTLF